MKQYLDLMKHTLDNGVMQYNKRTNSYVLTTVDATFKYNVDEFPLVTTRKSYWKQAICELLCYIREYKYLKQFHSLGVHTWDENVKNWESAYKVSTDHAGVIYGSSSQYTGVSYKDICFSIRENPSDRGIIWNFWNPEYFDRGCLRPCLYAHQFTVLDGKLYLTSTQRSVDIPLGLNFNMVQAWFLCAITAKITGLEFGGVTHHLVNCHIYENQVALAKEQINRIPFQSPKFIFKKPISFIDLNCYITKDNFDEYFAIEDYQYHPAIKYPFTA